MKQSILILILILFVFTCHEIAAQDQAIFLQNPTEKASISTPSAMPVDAADRTISFWIKVEKDNSTPPSQKDDLMIFGTSSGSTAAIFNILLSRSSSSCDLYLNTGETNGTRMIAQLRDAQWHFVTITYGSNTIKSYLDGVITPHTHSGITLATATSTNIVWQGPAVTVSGKRVARSISIDNFSIWSTVRAQNKIKSEMKAYPPIQGDETELVAYFPFNDSRSRTSISSRVTGTATATAGTLSGGAAFTKPINLNQSLTEGIYYVVQNIEKILNDVDLPAKLLALRPDGNGYAYEKLPTVGDIDPFLIQLVPQTGVEYKIKTATGTDGNRIEVESKYPNKYGTNTFVIHDKNQSSSHERDYISLSTNGDGTHSIGYGTHIDRISYQFTFQPVKLVHGYHLPSSGMDQPVTRVLETSFGNKIYGTNTTSEWAILNSRIIIENMVNAIKPAERRQIGQVKTFIISRYDDDQTEINSYPGLTGSTFGNVTRGGFAYDPHNSRYIALVTEEMMCRTGVYVVNEKGWGNDQAYREFDQLVHEFGHAIDYMCAQSGDLTPVEGYLSPNRPRESYASSVQAWFNSGYSYPTFLQNRKELAGTTMGQYTYMQNAFDINNVWLPPRNFRKAVLYLPEEDMSLTGKTPVYEISSKTINSPAYPAVEEDVMTSAAGNNSLNLGNDGNLVNVYFRTGGFITSTYEEGISTGANSITFDKGQLSFTFPSSTNKVGLPAPATGSKFLLSSENGHRGDLKVIGSDGKTLWRPELTVQGGKTYNVIYQNARNKVDYGAHDPSNTTTLPYWLRNSGVVNLSIKSVSLKNETPTAGAFSIVNSSALVSTLAPHGGKFFDISFTPPAHGSYEADVEITYDASYPGGTVADKKFVFKVRGIGTGRLNIVGWTKLEGEIDGLVNALLFDRNGNLYAGGNFPKVGSTTVNNIAVREPSGTWKALSTGVNGTVNALAEEESDGSIYVAGEFTSVGKYAAKWSSNTWTAYDIDEVPLSLATDPTNNDIYAGTASSGKLYRHNGTSWTHLTRTGEGVGKVQTLLVDNASNVYVGVNASKSRVPGSYYLGKRTPADTWQDILTGDITSRDLPVTVSKGLIRIKSTPEAYSLRVNTGVVNSPHKREGVYRLYQSGNNLKVSGLFSKTNSTSSDKKRYLNLIRFGEWDGSSWNNVVENRKPSINDEEYFLSGISIQDSKGRLYGLGVSKISTFNPILLNENGTWELNTYNFPYQNLRIAHPSRYAIDTEDNIYMSIASGIVSSDDKITTDILKYIAPLPVYDVAEKDEDIWMSGKKIWNWNGTKWIGYTLSGINQYAKRIDVDYDGKPWIVDKEGALAKLKPDGSFGYNKDNRNASNKSSGITDIAVHTSGSIWAISDVPTISANAGGIALTTNKDFTILHYGTDKDDPSKNSWNSGVSGGAIAIDVENDGPGTPWVVSKAGKVYRYQVPPANSWLEIHLPAGVKAIDLADGGQNSDDMYVLGDDGYVYKVSGSGSSWSFTKVNVQFANGGKRLAHTKSDVLWITNLEAKLYQKTSTGTNWDNIE